MGGSDRDQASGDAALRRDTVVMACSAGGLAPLKTVVAGLDADLPAAILVVRHVPPDGHSALPAILSRVGSLSADHARHAGAIFPGHIHIAPPDHHLVIHDHETWLSRGPRINRVRPAADALFRSAARWCGPRTVGVVLSGALDDGAAGLATIAERGGTVLVQDPRDALNSGMPESALAAVPGAVVLGAEAIAAEINKLAGTAVEPMRSPAPEELLWETDITELGELAEPMMRQPGRATTLSCPACHGAMTLIESGDMVHYACHVGHAFSPATMLAEQADITESALWSAVAILEERARVRHELATRAAARRRRDEYSEHSAAVREATDAARAVRGCISRRPIN